MASRHKRRYTSAEMAELILPDNDENSDNSALTKFYGLEVPKILSTEVVP